VVLGVNTICTAGVGFPGGFGFLVGFLKAAFVQIFRVQILPSKDLYLSKKTGSQTKCINLRRKTKTLCFHREI